jgi:hypothetical protein
LPPNSPDQGLTLESLQQQEPRNAARPSGENDQQQGVLEQALNEQLSSPSPERSPLVSEMAYEHPPLSSSVYLSTQNQSNQLRSPSKFHKRQRIQVPMPSLKGRVDLINAHIASVGGIQHLNDSLEQPRFRLLSDACNTEDIFYVALHQLFCVWDSAGHAIIASIPGLPPTHILAFAFKILGQLIRDNEGLASNHLEWFVDFPSPLVDLMRTSEAYSKTIMTVGQFLGKLAPNWGPMSALCSGRGYPPLVDEMTGRMGLVSPTLQQVMFTAMRRNLQVPDDLYGNQMEKTFAEDKQGYQELAARFNTGRPPTEKEIMERNKQLIHKYLSIINQRNRARRVSEPVMGSPLTGSPAVPAPTNLQHSASNNSNDASRPQNPNQGWNQSYPSPDLRNQSQQQIQHGRVTSTSSPNPLLQAVAGRPPSVTGYQVSSNAPSPTLLQSLSMNSPVVQSPTLQQQGFQWSAPTPVPVLRNNSFQVQPAQNMAGYPNGPYDMRAPVPTQQQQPQQQRFMMQQQHQQLAVQQPQHVWMLQQQQQIAAQQQQAMQAQQWQQQAMPQAQHQAHQATQAQQQARQAHHQQFVQQRQRAATQQALQMNHSAPLRREPLLGSDAVDIQQRVHSRNNSVSRAGRPALASRNLPNMLPQPARHIPSFTPDPVAVQQAVDMYKQTNPLQRNLIPPVGFEHPLDPMNPDMKALHQAHIRSPRLIPQEFPSSTPEEDPSRRYYQCVKGLALGPIRIPVSSVLAIFEFAVSEESFALISKDKVIGTDRLPIREFKRGSLQYRLRCIETKRDTTKCLVPDWVVSDTVWPKSVFVEINGVHLEIRRTNHHGKDLPIDITQFVIPKISPGNLNRIRISTPRLRNETDITYHFIAVEIVEVLQHQQIFDMCMHHQHVSASKTLDAIKKSLAPPPSDDDDSAMVISDLSIDLADPFTTTIFRNPVRGSSCLHRECFDLETFFLTRNSKPKRPNQPTMVDVWKCPLCGRDARPYSLQIDDFLVSVRAELEKQDKLETKAILVSADGSWRPKPEPRPMKRKATGHIDDDDGGDSSDGENTARLQQVVGRKNNPHLNGKRGSKEIEVIELDDD